MLVVGLTGGISSGKSTVSTWFKEKGVCVIDADEVVKELQHPNSDLLHQIEKVFGKEMIEANGHLNRKTLGQLIFRDKGAQEKLNAIIHPQVKAVFMEEIEQAKARKEPFIVLDVPLLYESQFDSLVDLVLVVYVSKEIQVKRLIDRDQIDEDYALAKINSQQSLSEKRERADIVLDNRGTRNQLKTQFEAVYEHLMNRKDF